MSIPVGEMGATSNPPTSSEVVDAGLRPMLVLEDHAEGYAWDDQNPLRSTLSVELDEATFLALKSVLDARKYGLHVRLITEPDLVVAVDELLHSGHFGSPSVGAGSHPASPIVGAAPGVDSPAAPGATPEVSA